MKSRDTLIRLKRFQVEEKRRRVRQIEMMVAEFNRMIGDLDREIANEEKRAGISDPSHFAYPTYARAAMARRDNLKQFDRRTRPRRSRTPRRALEEAQAELAKYESLEGREKANERAARDRRAAVTGLAPRHRAARRCEPACRCSYTAITVLNQDGMSSRRWRIES